MREPDQTMPDYEVNGVKKENKVPVIMSNLYQNGKRLPLTKDYVILDKTAIDETGKELPVRIGVIGYSADYGQSIKKDLYADLGYEIIEDMNALETMALKLKNEDHCQAVLLLTHTDPSELIDDFPEDTAIDLILGGHVHMNDSGLTPGGTPYLMPDGLAGAYCYADLVFEPDASGKAVFKKAANVRTVSSDRSYDALTAPADYPEEMDDTILQITKDSLHQVDAILNEPLGYITTDVLCHTYFPNSGERGSTCGNWVTSLIARAADADIAFLSRFGLRSDFTVPKTTGRLGITVGNLYALFPFSNNLYCYELSSDDLLEVLNFSLTPGGSSLLTFVSGLTVYYSDQKINAILRGGELLYDHGTWTKGHENDTFRVAVADFIGTIRERKGDKNPLFDYNSTSRLVNDAIVDNENVLRVIREEAAKNNGHLFIDTESHFILGDYVRPQ